MVPLRYFFAIFALILIQICHLGESDAMEKIEAPEVPPQFSEAKNTPRPYHPLPERNEGTLPVGYVHNAVGHQINDYRKLYKTALDQYNGDYDLMGKSPIAGLTKIAKNTFALAHDVIIKAKNGQSEDIKKYYLDLLEKLWSTFPKDQDAITSKEFQEINFELARIIEDFNAHKDIINYSYHLSFDAPVFIIYAKHEQVDNRGIASDRFVDEYFNKDFRAYLALFDVLSEKPAQRTGKNVHYSFFEGTHQMLNHDFLHIDLILAMPSKDYLGVGNILMGKIYDVAQKEKDKGNLNDYKILMNGLFLITHEKPQQSLWDYTYPYPTAPHPRDPNANLDEDYTTFVKKYCCTPDYFLTLIGNNNRLRYKDNFADWEYFLKVRDDNGEPFFDRKKITKEERYVKDERFILGPRDSEKVTLRPSQKYRELLEDGYKRFWKKFQDLALGSYNETKN